MPSIVDYDPIQDIYYSHLGRFLSPTHLKAFLSLAEKALNTHQFDTLAFRGMSGAFLGPALAARMNKNMILVRKPEDSTHFRQDVEGYDKAKRYIIVDDFTSSGSTKEAIIEGVRNFSPDATFVGLLEVKDIDEKELRQHVRKGTPYPLQ